jgi:hypothetical protein
VSVSGMRPDKKEPINIATLSAISTIAPSISFYLFRC